MLLERCRICDGRRVVADGIASITMRLEAYLLQLSNVNKRWANWLQRQEEAAIGGDLDGLNSLQRQAGQLIEELNELQSNRSQLLGDAAGIGLPARNVRTLARNLPAWKRSSLRQAINSAKLQLANIRRLHAAAWVLIHQLSQFYSGTILLLTEGATSRAVYAGVDGADLVGGQLLDADL